MMRKTILAPYAPGVVLSGRNKSPVVDFGAPNVGPTFILSATKLVKGFGVVVARPNGQYWISHGPRQGG